MTIYAKIIVMSVEIFKPRRKRNKGRRNSFTINSPFLTENIQIVNMDKLTEEQDKMARTANDFSYLKEHFAKYFIFEHVQYSKNRVFDDPTTAEPVIGERAFFKDFEHAKEFFKLHDWIRYVCFQYEQGKTGNLHLQGYMQYKEPLDYSTVRKKIMPTMSLRPADGTALDAINYCKKLDTKVDGFDFFEHGEPVEEGQRLDKERLKGYVINRTPYSEVLENDTYFSIVSGDRLESAQQKYLADQFKNVVRDVHTTYIYGKEGAGKTSYCERVLGYQPQDVYIVGEYDTDFRKGMFDEYNGHDILIFDEFDSSVEITKMNTWLNGRPTPALMARTKSKTPVFTKVFIISNYPIDHHWKKQRNDPENSKEPSYRGFLRRVKEIIYMPDMNIYEWQHGRPTDETIATLKSQNASVKLLPQEIEQTTMGVEK